MSRSHHNKGREEERENKCQNVLYRRGEKEQINKLSWKSSHGCCLRFFTTRKKLHFLLLQLFGQVLEYGI